MADAGKLDLLIYWDGQIVRKVEISSTRPQAFRLLNGQAPDNAVRMARLLFNVCSNAQGAAAEAAVAAAQCLELSDSAGLERNIACEAMQEHLWRLLLDWPKLLGLPSAQADFVRWHRLLRDIAAEQGDMVTLRAELETRWLGCPADEWRKGSLEDLQAWRQASDSPAARLLAVLDGMDAHAEPGSGAGLLPDWTAAQAVVACGDVLDADFVSQPVFHGVAVETGALGCYAETPLLSDLMRLRHSRLLARVLARVLDVLHIATGEYRGRLDSVRISDGVGLAVVQTARGLLLHRVQLDTGLVRNYLTVAPTEWNFHPCGALAAGLEGMRVDSRASLLQLAAVHVLSLDPCVEYGIEVRVCSQ